MLDVAAPESFSDRQRRWFTDACACVDVDALRRLAVDAVAIPSAAGAESALAEYFVAALRGGGMDAVYQPFAPGRGNAVARRSGDGSGPDVLLYAPFDMHIDGDAAGDGPWLDLDGRPDLQPRPVVAGDLVIGLGAENPKGHAVCVAAAGIALAQAEVPLRGDLVVGLCGGGMPVNASARGPAGHGAGCAALLEHGGVAPDAAVIAKPGGAVAYEEVGLCWFKLTVHGRFGYAGIPPRASGRNAIVDAATVVAQLTAWFPQYTARHTSGLVAPNGTVGAIAGGWSDKPAFLPDTCDVYVDLRISPRTTPADAARELGDALDAIRAAEPGLTVDCELIAAVPGTSTPPESWIVRSSIGAWEAVYGRPHALRTGTSGATDANVLRGHGIPTARIGMPPLGADAPFAGRFSMGVVSVTAMARLTAALIAIAIDGCTRTRRDLALLSGKEASPS
jgi:acetylornithine deacetylase/succinyl-diaminopimelate desuccinylase-like protein